MSSQTQYYGTGRRKQASARVFIKSGSGKILVNEKPAENYFSHAVKWLHHAFEPLDRLGANHMFDLAITVKGGGVSGQSGAVRMGLSRALVDYEKKNPGKTSLPEDKPLPESVLKSLTQSDDDSAEASEAAMAKLADINQRIWHIVLRKEGFLTRDARAVLRKLAGFVKHSKRKQFSKR